jgi:hypothetical protein
VLEPKEQRKTLGDAESVGALCTEIEGEIAALRAKYEQYFLGIERKPPSKEHESLKKKVASLRNTFVRQVAVKFRVDAVTQKLITYERLWTRTLQEIEAGTYRRDLYKLKMKTKEPVDPPPPPPVEKKAEPAKAAAAVAPVAPAKPVAPAVAAAAPTAGAKPSAPGAPAASGQLSDQKMKAIYDAYVTAKKRCNEDVSKISFDSLAHTLRKQVPELMKQHNAKSVEFKVVIKDGKAILRALPKDS